MIYGSIVLGLTFLSLVGVSQPTQHPTSQIRQTEFKRPVFLGNKNEYYRQLFGYAQSLRLTQPDSVKKYATFFASDAEKNKSFISTYRSSYLNGLFWVSRNQSDSVNKYLIPLTTLPDTDSTIDFVTMSLNQLGLFYSRSMSTSFYSIPYFMSLDSILNHKNLQVDRYSNLINLMNAHRRMGNYISALDDVQLVMSIDTVRWKNDAVLYMNTAEIYRMLKDDELAKQYLFKAIRIPSLPLPVKLSIQSSLALVYQSMNQQDSAIYYFRQVVSTPIAQPIANLFISPLLELSKTFVVKEPSDSVFYYLTRAEKIANDFNLIRELSIILDVKVSHLLKINQPLSALNESRRALQFAKHTNYAVRFGPLYELLSKAFEANNQSDSAIYYSRLALEEKDKHINLAYKNSEARSLVLYANRKETERLKSLENELSNSSFLTVLLSIISVGIFIAILLLFKRYQKNQAEVIKAKSELLQSLKKVKSLEEKQSKGEQVLLLSNKTILKLNDIKYVAVDGHHLNYHVSFQDAPIIERNAMADLKDRLPEDEFIQIHRSIVVNKRWIQSFQSEIVTLKTGEQLKISRTFKGNISKIMSR